MNTCDICGVDKPEGKHPFDECMTSRMATLSIKAAEASYDKYFNRKNRIKEKNQTEWE